ncbi:MAG: TolB family protein [Myxococcaceae bacterium]
MRHLHACLPLLLCLACQGPDRSATPPSLGKRVSAGLASDVRVTADGRHGVFLANARKPAAPGVPPQMTLGELHWVALDGSGAKRKLGEGVTNLPGGFLFTPDGQHVLFREAFRVETQSGRLKVADVPGGEVRLLGESVTSMAVSRDSKRIAFVEGGVLKEGPLTGTAFRTIAGEVSNAEFSADGSWLVFRRTLVAGGALLATRVDGKGAPVKLGEQVADYSISPASDVVAFTARSPASPEVNDLWHVPLATLKPAALAMGTGTFAFSPDGQWLARTEGQRPEQLGDLFVGPARGGPGRKLGERVMGFGFSPQSDGIAYLERYDLSQGLGILGVAALPDGKPRRVGDRVPTYDWSPDGKYLAFQSRFLKPVVSLDLMIFPPGAEKAEKVATGVFGYAFSPSGGSLLLRTKCVREGRACDLNRLELAKLGQPSEKLVEGVFNFRVGAGEERVLFTHARTDADTFDVSIQNFKTRARTVLDKGVQLPVFLTGTEADRVVYAIAQGPRAGLYVAEKLP